MLRYLMTTFLFVIRLPGIWPNFNAGFQPPSQPPPHGATSGEPSVLAWVALGLGIASWTILPLVGAFGGAGLGWLELQNIKKGTSNPAGKTIAQVGFWLSVVQIAMVMLFGCISVALSVLVFGSFAAMLAAMGASAA